MIKLHRSSPLHRHFPPHLILVLLIVVGGLAVGLITSTYLDTPIVGRTPLTNELTPSGPNEAPLVVQSTLPSPSPTLAPLPESKVLTGSTHVFQTFNNCGPASLSMTLSFYDQAVSQQQLGNQLRPYQVTGGDNDDKSVTLAELAEKAGEYGFLTFHRPAGDIVLLQQFVAHDIPVIALTWLKPGEDIGHYRVVKGYDLSQEVLIQDDSLQGKDLSYSYNEFNELWQAFNYEFLVLVPPEKEAVTRQILGDRAETTTAWQRAAELAQAQLAANPTDAYAQFNLAKAYYYLGEYQQAVDSYQAVASQLPNRMLWYQIEPILAYYQLGEYETVLAMSQQILDNQNRAFSELHQLRGDIFTKQGDSDRAQEAYALAERYNSARYWKSNLDSLF